MKSYVGLDIPANYFRGIEAVGGKLFFDETGMTFKSHALNIQTGETRIDYSQVQEAKRERGILPTLMVVLTKDGIKHRFVLSKRPEKLIWVTQSLVLQTAVMAAMMAISLGLDGAVTETTANYFDWSVK